MQLRVLTELLNWEKIFGLINQMVLLNSGLFLSSFVFKSGAESVSIIPDIMLYDLIFTP